MSREIKFRFWSTSRNMWFNPDDVIMKGDEIFEDWRDFEDYLPVTKGSYEIMQYTGLKDKNGKEIYEGDIVEEYEDGRWLWVVGWNETYGCLFVHAPIQNEHFNTSDMEDVFRNGEVIGNIYENPELLESET